MKTPLVSVILPCYNVEKYIGRCLDCLANQSLKDIEIICVDDKSNDETKNIIKRYTKNDNRIRLIELKCNSGAAIARNAGLNIARGKYIGFVDPDDYVDMNFYEKLYKSTLNNQYDVVIGNIIISEYDSGTVFINSWVQSSIKENGVIDFTTCFWSGIYKHSFLKKHNIKFPDEIRYSQDCVFLTMVSLAAKSIYCVPDTFYHYFYRRPGSLDSDMLNHAKALSKYNAFKMNLDYINNTQFDTESQKQEYIAKHVLFYADYEVQKKYENDDDRKNMFDLLHLLATSYLPKKYFNKKYYKYIKSGDYRAFIYALHHKLTKHKFCKIPILYIYEYENEKRIKLFKFIPIWVKRRHK